MAAERVLHGLIQKSKLDAERIAAEIRITADGRIWRMGPYGWIWTEDRLTDPRDREDFLVGKLTQEER